MQCVKMYRVSTELHTAYVCKQNIYLQKKITQQRVIVLNTDHSLVHNCIALHDFYDFSNDEIYLELQNMCSSSCACILFYTHASSTVWWSFSPLFVFSLSSFIHRILFIYFILPPNCSTMILARTGTRSSSVIGMPFIEGSIAK